jgi:hypothetical protein
MDRAGIFKEAMGARNRGGRGYEQWLPGFSKRNEN